MNFYRTPGPMTELPAETGDLPTGSRQLAELVQGILIHRDWAPAYGLDTDDIRIDEQQLRTTGELLARIRELGAEPLTVEREPVRRVLCICRHFALLHTAFLRAQGEAARVRCGFANYFDPDKWYDHWITERWDDGRWTREDPQVDGLQLEIIKPDFDVMDQPPGRFLTGAEAWVAARSGTVDADRFGIADMWGIGFIAGNVIADVACLNKVELLPWDGWGEMVGPGDEIDDRTNRFLDEVAALVNTDDIAAIRRRYEADERLRVPADITTFIDGRPVPVRLDL